jgi:hypothetical protein
MDEERDDPDRVQHGEQREQGLQDIHVGIAA